MYSVFFGAVTVPRNVALPLFIILPIVFIILFGSFYFYLIWALRLKYKLGVRSSRIWQPTDKFNLEKDTVSIKKDPQKDFVILTLADIQVHDLFRLKKDRVIYKTIEGAIASSRPDLIVLLGDNCWGYSRQCYKKLVEIMDGFGLPWAPIFGNHDCEGNADLAYLSNIMEQSKYCLFRQGPRNLPGVGNYAINILEKDKIIHTLFLFDTGTWKITYDENKVTYLKADDFMKEKMPAFYVEKESNGPHEGETLVGGSWGTISYQQIDYYKWLLEGITEVNGKQPLSSMYIHIPLYEYNEGYFEWVKGGCDPDKGFGEVNEKICSPALSCGMFDAIVEEGSTKDVIAGHDHENNLSVLYRGVRLSYGMKCADECSWREYMSGGSVLTVHSDGKTDFKHVFVRPNGLRHGQGLLGKIFR